MAKKSVLVTSLLIVAVSWFAFSQCKCLYSNAESNVDNGIIPLCWYEFGNCWCNNNMLCCEVYVCWPLPLQSWHIICQPLGYYKCFEGCDEPMPLRNLAF